MNETILTSSHAIEELVDDVTYHLFDTQEVHQHYAAGTIDVLYAQAVQAVVTSVLMLPYRRVTAGLSALDEDDEEAIPGAVKKMARVISITCGKPIDQVETDLVNAVQQFPTDDIRQTTFLRQTNRLN